MNEQKLQRLAEWSVGLEISGTAISTAKQAQDIHIADHEFLPGVIPIGADVDMAGRELPGQGVYPPGVTARTRGVELPTA